MKKKDKGKDMLSCKKVLKKGLTLIELLVVIAILGVMATVLVTIINPGRQFAKARDMRRETDLIAILSAIFQYTSEHSGDLPDIEGGDSFPTSLTCIGTDASCFNLAGAGESGETIVPEYMAEIPEDPQTGDAANTGYELYVDANGRLVASASGETHEISLTK